MLLFSFQMMFSIVVFVLSILWKHWLAIVFGVIFMLIVVYGLSATIRGKIHSQTKVIKIAFVFFNVVFNVLIFIFFIVQVIAWDNPQSHFPTGCKKTTNCCRLTLSNSTNVQADGMTSPVINTTIKFAKDTVQDWMKTYNSAGTLYDSDTFIHARFVSFFFGFPDDFYVEFKCQVHGSVNIEIQSEAREGTGDFDVNRSRVKDLLQYIGKIDFAPGKCGP